MRRAVILGLAIGALSALAGCASKYMKGTPLYTGEYPKREGPAEDRVNLWPLAYYRKPALSILWPLMEATDDHLALRPFYSVYKLDKPHHEYNVFAPFAQFDYEAGQHHVLPADWGVGSDGKPYFNVLPLAWSGRDANDKSYFTAAPFVWYKEDDYFNVFPFWLQQQLKGGYDSHILWPIGRRVKTPEKDGFDVWPLVGAYQGVEDKKPWSSAYALWPLAGEQRKGDQMNRWVLPIYAEGREKDRGGLLIMPVFYHDEEAGYRRTFTPLWSFGGDDHVRWDLVLPAYFHRHDQREQGNDWTTLTPLWSGGRDGATRWDLVFPLAYRRAGGQESLTLTPLWWSVREPKAHWDAVLPLYYHSQSERGWETATPLWMGGLDRTRRWDFVPPLFYREADGERSFTWALLWASTREPTLRQDIFFPVYGHYKEGSESLTMSPVWLAQTLGDVHWETVPLLYYRQESPKGTLTLSPIGSHGESGPVRWRSSLPFYYERHNSETKTDLYLTPLAGREITPDQSRTTIFPLLSSMAWRGEEKDFWLLAPLSRFRWGGGRTQSHVFPLYYSDSKEGLFLSLPYSRQRRPDRGFTNVLGMAAHFYWEKDGRRDVTLPLALSAYGSSKDGKSLDVLLGLLAHAEWGGARLRHRVAPLYAYDREEHEFLSPLVSWQNKPESSYFNVLGLLAHYTHDGRDKSLRLLLPLTYFRWGGPSSESTVFPLFSWGRDRTRHPIAAPDSHEWLWVAPWIWSERTVVSDFQLRIVPRPAKTGEERSCQFFPFWHSSGSKDLATGQEKADFHLLGPLYDYQYRSRVEWSKDPKDVSDYTRARILWRVMHYERTGGDSTLDVFPFITADRRADGSRQFSFLWRLYRHQRTADGGRNLDVLLIPILRHRGVAAGASWPRSGEPNRRD